MKRNRKIGKRERSTIRRKDKRKRGKNENAERESSLEFISRGYQGIWSAGYYKETRSKWGEADDASRDYSLKRVANNVRKLRRFHVGLMVFVDATTVKTSDTFRVRWSACKRFNARQRFLLTSKRDSRGRVFPSDYSQFEIICVTLSLR